MLRIILISLCLIVFFESVSQKKKRKSFFKKNKKKEAVVSQPDTIDAASGLFILDQDYLDSLEVAELQLEIDNRVSQEKIRQIILTYDVPVRVTDRLAVDSVWLAEWDYFSTWSSTKVNPYELDGEKFSDTVNLPLVFENPNLTWSSPISKMEVTSPFGLRRWRWHYGDDFRLKIGDSIRVSFDGIVRLAHYDRYGYGNYILVRHYNGLETLYGHLKKRLARVGDRMVWT